MLFPNFICLLPHSNSPPSKIYGAQIERVIGIKSQLDSEAMRVRPRSYSNAWQLLFSPEAVVPFLLGSLMMAVAGNALYELLTNLLGTSNNAIIGIGIGALLMLVSVVVALKHFFKQFRVAPSLAGKRPPQPRKGLILLISREEIGRKAINWHSDTLRHCWLLYSAKSESVAETLRRELGEKGVQTEMLSIADIFDPLEFKQKVEGIYAALSDGLAEADVMLDFTGMTSCAAVGSVIACLDEQRPMQYTPAEYDSKLNAVQALDPVEVILHWGLLRMPASFEPSMTNSILNAEINQGMEVEQKRVANDA